MGSNYLCQCGINESMSIDTQKYSDPVPLIGFYIAAATLVCLLLMICDIFLGIRRKKSWLPCRFFSLNSITLTLLSIATKITVDLTTTLPCDLDQLSKLTGTALICVSMGFLMPSLGTNRKRECLTNMGALSIFVVTVIINIYIQMRTRVIMSFHVEHVIILCCMLVLLTLLWFSAFDISSIKEDSIDRNKSFLTKGPKSLLKRLELCYLYGYDSNPQFALCRHPSSFLVGSFCIVCLVVVGQATIRSDLSSYDSDYKWSIMMIVLTQIATVLVGCLGANLRWLSLGCHINTNLAGSFMNDEERNAGLNPFFDRTLEFSWYLIFKVLVFFLVLPIQFSLSLPLILLCKIRECMRNTNATWCCMRFIKHKQVDDEAIAGDIKEFEDLIHKGGMGIMEEWILRKGFEDMKKWTEKYKIDTPSNLIKLLSSKVPTYNNPNSPCINKFKHLLDSHEGYEISSLSLVLVAQIANASIPFSLSCSLMRSLDEVFDIIYFIDSRINFTSIKNMKKCKVAKTVWIPENSQHSGLFTDPKTHRKGMRQSQLDLNRAIGIIRELKSGLGSDFVSNELSIILSFIDSQVYGSIKELYSFIEQLFIDMLKEFLSRLPIAIFKEIIESLPEEFEERVRHAMRVLCKAEAVDVHVQWSFPAGSSITCLTKNRGFIMNDEKGRTQLDRSFIAAIGSFISQMLAATMPHQSEGIYNNSSVMSSC